MQTVQSFTLEELQIGRYADAVKSSFLTAVRRIRMNAVLIGLAFVLIFCMLTLFLWVGSRAVLAGSMTGGQLGQFLMYAFFVGTIARGTRYPGAGHSGTVAQSR